MENTELRKLLEQIHDELHQVKSIGPQEQEILRDLSADIQELLQQANPSSVNAPDSVLGRIEDVISQMEVEHPILTSALSQLLSVLSNAGI